MTKKKKGKGRKTPNFIGQVITTMLVIFTSILIFSSFGEIKPESEEIPILQVAQDVKAGMVSKLIVEGDKVTIQYKDESIAEKTSKKEDGTALTDTLANFGVTNEDYASSSLVLEVKKENGFGYWAEALFPFLLPILLIGAFIWFISRQAKGAGMQAFTFGQTKARMTNPNDKSKRVTFNDVAGNREAKEELQEIVDFLSYPKKFIDIGAEIPKGVMLTGVPGTGKTLLARAVAGEAGVPFFHLSGSEFVEMFVGVGASRVRDLFKLAKKAAPAIVFIDEIDAVGRVRGSGTGGGNDEREQTLNQILVEMDGFETNQKVIVMAATNRSDVLDPALLRPGRFDRRVNLDLPDRRDREAILKIHSAKKPFAEDVNLEVIAARTPGFSGADLQSLMNEGAILAAREDRKKVSQFDLVRSIEKVMLGPERKSHVFSDKEKKITAYHEAGHAVIASVLTFADPVHKVSIVSRGRTGGYTLKIPDEDRRLQSKNEFLDDIAMSLGGYVAEKMIFGDITTGPSNDLQVSTNLARAMVTRWGMSDKIGPIALESDGGRPLFGMVPNSNEYSEVVSAKIDEEVEKIIHDSLQRAEETLTTYKKALDAVANTLLDVETLEREEYEKIVEANGVVIPHMKNTQNEISTKSK